MKTEEVAKLLKVHNLTVRRWIKAGRLSAIDVGREYRIAEADLQTFLMTLKVKQNNRRKL